MLSQVKLIAEPWDLGEGGYQLGNFPVLWTEWNGRYRDCVRRFWRGDRGTVAELATRLAGSSDLYAHTGRRPYASINFVTSHDGFTLHDLVTYEQKRNEANGEDNRDGENHNLSWNCGVEGPTDDAAIRALRGRQKRNLRTLTDERRAFLECVRHASRLMREHAALRRRRFFHGRRIRGAEVKDIMWLAPGGQEMTEAEWNADHVQCFGVRLAGDAIGEVDEGGAPIVGDTLVYLLNAASTPISFTLPSFIVQPRWENILDTFDDCREGRVVEGGSAYPLAEHSLAVFRLRRAGEDPAA